MFIKETGRGNFYTQQLWGSNIKTHASLQFKQWDPRSEAQILRTKVCGSNTESPGLHFMSCRPGISIFELQTLGLSIWTADQGSHCLNCRPGVSLFELQTRGLTVWIADLGSQYLIADLRSQYLICRPDLQVQIILASNGCQIYTVSLVSFQ